MTLLIILIVLTALLGVLLLARWRVVLEWHGRVFTLRVRFIGLSKLVWTRDILALDSNTTHERRMSKSTAPDTRLYQDIIDQIIRIADHREVILETSQALLTLTRKFGNWWRLDSLGVEVDLGMGDPAKTGMAHGALSALAGMLAAAWPQVKVISRPDFDRTLFDSRGEVVFSVRLWDPLRDILAASVTIPWRRLWKLRREVVYQ